MQAILYMEVHMKTLSDWISEGFIWGVGITRPQPANQRRAALYITGLLAATVAGVVTLFFLVVGRL
jgi:hypothetical protein